jgi:hypothetical protein
MSNNPYAQQPSSSQGGQVYTESNRNPWTGGAHTTNQDNAGAYKSYVEAYPDLMADYEQNWAGQGMSLEDYGSMHYYGKGQNEGRELGGSSTNNQAPAAAQPPQSSGGGGGGGGGGGSQNDMIAEMQRQEQAALDAEAERKAGIEKNNAHINSQFDARAPAYDQYANDLYQHNMTSYDDSANKARNQMDFAMARTGNVGGSVEADTQGNLEGMYQEGLTNLKSGSRDAANSLKGKDDAQRNNLLQQSASGSYNPNARSSQPTFADTSMTSMSAGVGNQFQSLLGGIGGASKQKNPFSYGGY